MTGLPTVLLFCGSEGRVEQMQVRHAGEHKAWVVLFCKPVSPAGRGSPALRAPPAILAVQSIHAVDSPAVNSPCLQLPASKFDVLLAAVDRWSAPRCSLGPAPPLPGFERVKPRQTATPA